MYNFIKINQEGAGLFHADGQKDEAANSQTISTILQTRLKILHGAHIS
jgi:hypothetical protein